MAKENIANAALSDKVEVVQGNASDSLANLHPDVLFDLVFIDADKQSNLGYFTQAKRLVRKGGVIVRDPTMQIRCWVGKIFTPRLWTMLSFLAGSPIQPIRTKR